MRSAPTFIILLAVLLAGFAFGEETRELEQRIALLLKGKVNPLNQPPEVTLEQVQQARALVEKKLQEKGVEYVEFTAEEMERFKLSPVLAHYMESGAIRRAPEEWDLNLIGSLFRPKGMKPKKSIEESTSMWDHPDTLEYVKEMVQMGVRLVIDPTMKLTGGAAFYSPGPKAVRVGPDVLFAMLRHEGTHAKMDRYQIRDFYALAKSQPENRETLIKTAPWSGLGEENLRQVLRLIDQGYPYGAVNEAMAVTAELEENSRPEYKTPAKRLAHGPRYVQKWLVTELRDIAERRPLTSAERVTFAAVLMARLAQEKSASEAELRQLQHLVVDYIVSLPREEVTQLAERLRTWRASGTASTVLGKPFPNSETAAEHERFVKWVDWFGTTAGNKIRARNPAASGNACQGSGHLAPGLPPPAPPAN